MVWSKKINNRKNSPINILFRQKISQQPANRRTIDICLSPPVTRRFEACTPIVWSCAVISRLNQSAQIGGQGFTVEIDEAIFSKHKYNKCRLVYGIWIFGGIF
ncbi:hypothetical protein RF11_14845 [Thelohanellus kitauei]|uniref:Uncharacterized protein n=1 Tax=Thelohanellus kitauei TaxID=669202 RepID=A0A0C2N9D8_THEKT|nr:hypothetical protein RF11_14845 [Thelohanellus kitauei]